MIYAYFKEKHQRGIWLAAFGENLFPVRKPNFWYHENENSGKFHR